MFFGKASFLSLVFILVSILTVNISAFAQNDDRVPFRHRVGNLAPENNIFHIKGDFTIIGNTNLTLANYQENVQNALENMIYVDIDNEPETFNSSAATLQFSSENGADPNCSEILYAGLYWSGRTEPDKGLTFEVSKRGGLDSPATLDKKEDVLRHLEKIDYLPFTFSVLQLYENGAPYPHYEFLSNNGSQVIIFRFNSKGKVLYSIDNSEFKEVEDLKITTSNDISTASFKPITFSFENLTYSISELTKTTSNIFDELTTKDNTLKLITSGTYRPYIYYTEQFDKRRIKLKAPGAAEYVEVNAAGNAVLFPQEELQEMYVGYADVTQLVRDHGTGEYTVADIALTEGMSDNTGFYGHWGLIVVYQNSKMNLRDVTIFDGYSFVESQNSIETVGEIEIKGFATVKEGPVSLKLGVLAGEGDKPISGDFLEILDQNGNWTRLSHPNNDPNNFFNSSIYTPVRTEDGSLKDNPRNPFLNNNTGIDIVQWDIPNPENSIITNNQTSARFRYGTNQDVYTLYSFAFSVLSYSPDIQAHNYLKSINGEIATDSPEVRPGEEMTYQVDLRNAGTETSEQTQIVIPIPHTASFVSAKVIPDHFGKVTFDPSIGFAGAIIWELGSVPLMNNKDEIVASLEYTLKLTEDCFVLANDNCDSRISVSGSIAGIGGISKQTYSNIPFIKEFMDGDCDGYGIYGSLEIPITGKAEFAATHCSEFDLFTTLGPINLPEFCQGDTPADLSELISSSEEGYQVYFFLDEMGGTPLMDYYVNTSLIGTEQIWVSEGPLGSCTGLRIPVDLTVIPKSPEPQTEDKIFCMGEDTFRFNVDATPGFTVFYYVDNDPLTPPLANAPLIELLTPGEFSVWVSQFKEGECESIRKEVKILVEDCSLAPDIQLSISSNVDSYINEGEQITFTVVVKNIGGIQLQNIYVLEHLSNNNWNIASLNPSEERIFTFVYNVSNENIQSGIITLLAETSGISRNGEFVNDYEQMEVPGVVFPPGFLEYDLAFSPALCQADGIALSTISINWPQLHTGTYIIQNMSDGKEYTGEFKNQNKVQYQVPAGDYAVIIRDSAGQSHSIPDLVAIEKTSDVEFQIPAQLETCGEFLLAPETWQDLEFKIIAPDGSVVTPNSDNLYPLVQKGVYIVIGSDPLKEMCSVEKSIQADIILPYKVDLEVMPYCSEDSSTTIFLSNELAGHQINWYKTGNGGKEQLEIYENSTSLLVQEDGEYSVTLINSEGCTVGIGQIQVTKSFTEPPIINSLYSICELKNVMPAIEPGSRFTEYSWILNGVEVSNSSIFTPTQAGNYNLVAKDIQGCAFIAAFEVEIKCVPEVKFPNAIQPGNLNKAFEIYPDNLTDEIQVSIFNRWGQHIYYCEDKNLENEIKSACVWDGTFNGIEVQNGSYLVLIRVTNKELKSTISHRSSVLVFD